MTSQLIPLAQLTMVHRLAAIYLYREFPEAGGLVSYGPTESDTSFAYRRVAYFVDHLLRGVMYGRRPRCKRNLTISEAFGCGHVFGL